MSGLGVRKKRGNLRRADVLAYNLMMIPGILILLVFCTAPLFGIAIAFQKFVPAKGILGSKWVGLANFEYMLQIPDSMQVVRNTLLMSVGKILFNIVFSVFFALLLNEVKNKLFKRSVQTIVYLPHFLSWVILGSVFLNIFSLDGIVNKLIQYLGGEAIMFTGSNTWFRPLLIFTDVWKEFGYGAIIYMAALTAIDPNLYEAAAIDGANKYQRLMNVTLPSIVPTIVLMVTLNLGNILNGGFDQVYNMYNRLVYESVDIIDTYVYRMGIVDMQFSFSTAVGLLKSLVSMVLISLSYFLADRFAGYRIF